MEKIWRFCSFICHQHLNRSFYLNSTQFPLCVRCTSLYLSCTVMVAILLLYIKFHKVFIFYVSTKGYFMLFFFMFLIYVDVFTGYFEICSSNNISRVVTGFLCGSSFILLVYSLVSLYCFNKFRFVCPIISLSIKELIKLIFIATIFFFILLYLFFAYKNFFFVLIFLCLIGYFIFCFCVICYFLFLILKLG